MRRYQAYSLEGYIIDESLVACTYHAKLHVYVLSVCLVFLGVDDHPVLLATVAQWN